MGRTNEIPAEVYERYWVPAIFAPWARLHIARASLHPGERVLDVACGTGVVARLAAEIVGPAGRVTGLDISPGLLEVARTLDSGQQVEWHEGDALSLPFANSSFDSALSAPVRMRSTQTAPERNCSVKSRLTE